MDNDEHPELLYRIALSMIPGIGGITARKILSKVSSPEAFFKGDKKLLNKIPRAGKLLADLTIQTHVMQEARKELEYIRSEGISTLYFEEPGFPARLAKCHDAPIMLYQKGAVMYDAEKIIGIVGTRRPTQYGIEMCKRLVRDLVKRDHDCVIVSGLAYGIDHCAHQSALDHGLKTIAVLGHGLRFMYPAMHRKTAARITGQGALVTDFYSGQKPEPKNFIRRNRIIAGLSDALIVVESGIRGGALITADIAGSYHREVLAFPGRSGEAMSSGCNQLIKTNKAALIENCNDLEYLLGWEPSQQKDVENTVKADLNRQEEKIVKILMKYGEVSMDSLCQQTALPVSKVSGLLLNLEFMGLIASLPGNSYRLSNNHVQDLRI